MQIQVTNDNKTVFVGTAEQWLTDNQGDEVTAEMIAETAEKGWAERNLYHSGKWEVRRIDLPFIHATEAEKKEFAERYGEERAQRMLKATSRTISRIQELTRKAQSGEV